MSPVSHEFVSSYRLPEFSVIDLRGRSQASRFAAQDAKTATLRSPSRIMRQLVIGTAFAIPGAVAGLLVGLFPHPVVNAALALIGAMAGMAIGAWIERR
ncbi:hypothetical protein Pan44_51950 [Caulifigura coniformis]|uniref:Positive regulator of sigma(E), RseC/MucC n=2 Tax=Caulifigura coniformis TaxID=2527983 RepID=A0A517SLX6_9PLAN|nr:hypothetical protein Pan44_51950 [Caulifigura coniformis]